MFWQPLQLTSLFLHARTLALPAVKLLAQCNSFLMLPRHMVTSCLQAVGETEHTMGKTVSVCISLLSDFEWMLYGMCALNVVSDFHTNHQPSIHYLLHKIQIQFYQFVKTPHPKLRIFWLDIVPGPPRWEAGDYAPGLWHGPTYS
jgi:hypothetical protein